MLEVLQKYLFYNVNSLNSSIDDNKEYRQKVHTLVPISYRGDALFLFIYDCIKITTLVFNRIYPKVNPLEIKGVLS
jgi:hypothetical protein